MERIFLCVLSLSLSGAFVGAVLLLIHPFTKKWFSKKWNYYIWLLVIIRLLLPVHFEMAGGPQNGEGFYQPLEKTLQRKEYEDKSSMASPTKPEVMSEAEPGEAVKTESVSSIERTAAGKESRLFIFGIVWAVGAGISLLLGIRRYCHFTACMRRSSENLTDDRIKAVVDETAERLHLKKLPDVWESKLVPGPITFGLRKPVIVLPKEEREPARLSLVLHHELVHVKRKDLWYKWLYQTLLCIHWFNPILYLAGRKLNIDCELACDEAVLAHLTDDGKRAYGNILINAAERNVFFKRNIPSTTLLERRKDLKERLKGILHYKKQRKVRGLLSVCMLSGLLYLSACGSIQVSRDAMPIQVSAERAAERYEELGEKAEEDDFFWLSLFSKLSGYDVDNFLTEAGSANKNGVCWKMYEDERLIAGEDDHDQWRAYYYAGGNNTITSRGFVLNGSDSVLIVQALEETEITVESSFDLMKGKFKIVHVKPDESVELIDDTGEWGQRKISLERGRNVIKIVGREAKVKELSVSFSGLKKKTLEAVYGSEEEEYGAKVLDSIRAGNVDKDKAFEALAYMEDEVVSEILSALLAQKVPLTSEELCELFIFSDEELSGKYLKEAVEKGDFKADRETVIGLMPYLDDISRRYVLRAMGTDLDWETLCDCMPYLDDDGRKESLLLYMENGNRIGFSQFEDIFPYLDDGTIRELDKYLEEQ